jgi:hypothetical protein
MPEDTLLSLAASEPEQTRLILKVAGAGCVAVSAWVLLASWLMPLVAFVPLTIVILACYAGALVLMTGRAVHAADRWKIESATQAREFLSSGHPRPAIKVAAAASAPAYPNEVEVPGVETCDSGESFQRLYFGLQLEHEVRRCRREGDVLTVVVLEVVHPSREPRPAELEKMTFDIAKLTTDQTHTVVLPTYLGGSQYAFYVPDAVKADAKAQVFPLLKALGNYHWEAGFASYPGDGGDGEVLLTAAMEQLEDGRSARSAAERSISAAS